MRGAGNGEAIHVRGKSLIAAWSALEISLGSDSAVSMITRACSTLARSTKRRERERPRASVLGIFLPRGEPGLRQAVGEPAPGRAESPSDRARAVTRTGPRAVQIDEVQRGRSCP